MRSYGYQFRIGELLGGACQVGHVSVSVSACPYTGDAFNYTTFESYAACFSADIYTLVYVTYVHI